MYYKKLYDQIKKTEMLPYSDRGKHTLYLIYNKHSKRSKIGITNDIFERCSNIRTTSGCDLRLLWAFDFQPYCYPIKYLEKTIHDFFKEKRRVGEWFELTPLDVYATFRILNTVYEVEDYNHAHEDNNTIEAFNLTDIAFRKIKQQFEREAKKQFNDPIWFG